MSDITLDNVFEVLMKKRMVLLKRNRKPTMVLMSKYCADLLDLKFNYDQENPFREPESYKKLIGSSMLDLKIYVVDRGLQYLEVFSEVEK